MDTTRTIAIIVAVIAGVDSIRRLVGGRGLNTWTYVLEAGVLGGALGVIFSGSADHRIGAAIDGFVFFALSALVFDIWFNRPKD